MLPGRPRVPQGVGVPHTACRWGRVGLRYAWLEKKLRARCTDTTPIECSGGEWETSARARAAGQCLPRVPRRLRNPGGFGGSGGERASGAEGLLSGEELTNPSSSGAVGGRRGERWGQGGCGAPLPCREGGCIAKDAPLG